MQLRPIAINPGGQLPLEDIVGRDHDRDAVLRSIARQSVVLTGERRMGKTSLSRLVEALASAHGWTVVRQSAEGYTSLDELARALVDRLEEHGGALRSAAREVLGRLKLTGGPLEIDLAPRPEPFEAVIESAVDAAGGKLLLVLDELPLFAKSLDATHHEQRPGTAALHVLRRLRESHPGLRMLCLGSIGFHHVTRDASGVMNDTTSRRLEPLALDDAEYLAGCLLLGADLLPADPGVPAALAGAVEGVPYYLHRLIESLDGRAGARIVTAADGEATVAAALAAPDDPWDLRHYRDRIPTYYDDQAALASSVLDALVAGGGTLGDIRSRISTTEAGLAADAEAIRDVVERLTSDHYLFRNGDERRFAFDLVRRAWSTLRS